MPRVPLDGIEYTNKDYESFRTMMLDQLSVKMPEYTDKRQSDAGVVIIELNAQALDILSYYQDALANEVYLVTQEQRENALKWCRMLGYTPKSASPSCYKQVFVLNSPQPTDTLIPAWTIVKTTNDITENEVAFETIEDLIIPAGKLGDELDESGEYLYAVPTQQGVTVYSELVGMSRGTPNQRFRLNYTPVLPDSVRLYIDDGNGFINWTRVDSFIESGPESTHFRVTEDTDYSSIEFGDGLFGKIPPTRSSGIFSDYRIGGGVIGNVAPNKINKLDSTIAVVKNTFNPYPPEREGFDRETLDEIKVNAPLAHSTKWGALTLEDFASVAKLNFPEILLSTSYKAGPTSNDIKLYILLEGNKSIPTYLSEGIAHLFSENGGGRKIVGSGDVILSKAIGTPLSLQAILHVKPNHVRTKVESDIKDFLEDYFKLGHYPFDQTLSLSELSSQIMNPINGIEGIKSFRFYNLDSDFIIPNEGSILTFYRLTYRSEVTP